MPQLRTLDLFTGIGGLTRALHGLARPVAYCDWAPTSRATLGALFDRKLLPRAPVSPDVRKISKKWLKREVGNARVDMIVAGFPCTGFSTVGNQDAFENDQSGLFSEILRLADELDCPFLFLENVPNVLNIGMHDITRALSKKRGYELRWTISSAQMVGAPHIRARWFCLAVRPGVHHVWRAPSAYRPYGWGEKGVKEPARSTLQNLSLDGLRKEMLGNSVVPDAVRYAFLYLVSRCAIAPATLDTRAGLSIVPAPARYDKRDMPKPREWPRTAVMTVDRELLEPAMPLPPFRPPYRERIVLDPAAFKHRGTLNPRMTSGVLPRPVVRYSWATPRHANVRPASFLTRRCVCDLATQVRFARSTPAALRKGRLSAEFTEYLMGYPIGWTVLDAERLRREKAVSAEHGYS